MSAKEYRFVMKYIDEREITFIADSLEEAREKMESGDWNPDDELTLDFYAHELVKDLEEI